MNDFEFETETFNIQQMLIMNGVLCNSVCIVLMNRCAEYIKIIIITISYECVRLTHNMIYAIHLNDDGRSPSASYIIQYILSITCHMPFYPFPYPYSFIMSTKKKKRCFDSK